MGKAVSVSREHVMCSLVAYRGTPTTPFYSRCPLTERRLGSGARALGFTRRNGRSNSAWIVLRNRTVRVALVKVGLAMKWTSNPFLLGLLLAIEACSGSKPLAGSNEPDLTAHYATPAPRSAECQPDGTANPSSRGVRVAEGGLVEPPANREDWLTSVTNYQPRVPCGTPMSLGKSRIHFAAYANHMHNRLHPIFADTFLASLDRLPRSHRMNYPKLHTEIEVVLLPEQGTLHQMGVTRSSGVVEFDKAALESVWQASPFGPAPGEITSTDGRVYFRWEFWRERYYACSTYFVRPYLLRFPAADSRLPAGLVPNRLGATEYHP